MKLIKVLDNNFFVNKIRGFLKTNPVNTLSSSFKRFANKGFFSSVLTYSREATNKFSALEIVSNEAKECGMASIRHYEVQIASTKYWESIVTNIIYAPYIISSLFAFLIIPLGVYSGDISFWGIITLSKPINASTSDSALVIFTMIGLLLTFFLLLTLVRIFPKPLRQVIPILILIIYIVIASGLYKSAQLSDTVIFPLFSALLGQIVFLSVLIISLIFLTLNKLVFIQLRKMYYPDAVIVNGLINILSEVDISPSHWTDVSVRKKILMEIEEVSLCIQFNLYKRLQSGDSITDKWFEQVTKEIAASLRAKKLWILTPKSDTRLYFAQNITNTLLSIANGNWDMVEKTEPEKISTRQLWKDRINNISKVLIIGGAPIGLLWLIQNSPLALGKPISDYAIGVAILWGLFTAITTFDPLFGTKIDALKEIINLLPVVGRKP